MNFERFQEIKNKMEKLPNVEFFSLNEDAIILKNKNNKALYQIPFIMEEDDSITLHLDKGEKVTDGEKSLEQQFLENKNKFKNDVKKIFVNYEEGIKGVKENFKTFVNVDPSTFQEERKNRTYEETLEVLKNHKYAPIKNINTKFEKQLKAMNEEKQAFIQLFHIFDEENNLKAHELNYDHLKHKYEESKNTYQEFNTKLSKMTEFHKKLEDIVMNEELARKIISKINFTENLKITVPKALVLAKKSFNEDVNITDISKQVIKLYNEIFNVADENPEVFNRHIGGMDGGPVFLKFTDGKYSVRDLETLTHELEQSYYIVPDLTDEDLMQIADWRNQCEYMSRTGLISDKKVDEIINGFNSRFTLDTEECFNDGDNALGFKDSTEMRVGSPSGFNDNLGEKNVPEASIIADEDEFDDEDDEGFEVQKDAVIA